MKISKNLCFSFAALLLAAAPLIGAETVFVDTKFDQADESGKPVAIPKDKAAIPLVTPTALSEFAASNPTNPSTLLVGKTAIDSITPPYLAMYIGTRAQSASAPANTGVIWDLSPSHISQGIVTVSFDAAARQTDKTGGRFLVNFKTDAGKYPNAHPNLTPASLFFSSNGKIFVGAAPKEALQMSYEADRLEHYEIRIDMDKQMWGLKIGTAEIVKDASLADFFKTAGEGPIFVYQLNFTSEGGWGAQPDATFILKNVKVTQTTSPATKK